MKNKWRNYALKDGKVQSSYIREYSNRKKSGKAGETGYRDCFQQSRQKQEKEIELICREGLPIKMEPIILNDAWVINLRNNNESSRKENPSETYQEGRQGVSSSNQGRCEAQESNHETKNGEEKMKKESSKAHKKHEAKESKAYEKKEDKKEMKKEVSKGKK